jgi:hypothetical protein
MMIPISLLLPIASTPTTHTINYDIREAVTISVDSLIAIRTWHRMSKVRSKQLDFDRRDFFWGEWVGEQQHNVSKRDQSSKQIWMK